MAHFQLAHSRLFPNGGRLFVNGKSAPERFILDAKGSVELEIVKLSTKAAPQIKSSDPKVLSIGTPRKVGANWMVKFTAVGTGATTISATDGVGVSTSTFDMIVGSFLNHPQMDSDLIADAFRGPDSARKLALIRLLGNEVSNAINENSQEAINQWGDLACGTMSKVAGQKLFWSALDYEKVQAEYYKRPSGKVSKREDIVYDGKTLERGRKAIQAHLKAKHPVITGITYQPSSAVQSNGSLKETGAGGHTVLIVGCDADAKNFLYLDPYGPDGSGKPDFLGSDLQYLGGPKGANAFPDTCRYMGMFETIRDKDRGCDVLRQSAATQASGGMFSGEQYLEVISGPIN